jgi:predicted restriction endonuclease
LTLKPENETDQSETLDDLHEEALLNLGLDGPLEILQLVKARRGQGIFRTNVESRELHCIITGVSNPRYLRASHIKPWRKSTDIEKLDGNNGLMLAPHIDLLFDQGFISFEDDGTLIVSKKIDEDVLGRWDIPVHLNVGAFTQEQCAYLEFHRKNELKN